MSSDTYVQFDPNIGNFPALRAAGEYGPGREHEATVEIAEFLPDASKHDNEYRRRPAFDKESKQGPYCYFRFRVISEEFGLVTIDHHESIAPNSGSKALQFVKDAGVEVDEGGGFNPQALQGLELGMIRVGEPRHADDGRVFTGRVLEVAAKG